MRRVLLAIPILAVFAAVLGGGHYYLARRLALDPAWSPAVTALALSLIVAGAVSLVLQPIAERTLRPRWARFVQWPAALWMGAFFTLFWMLGLSDLLLLLGGMAAPERIGAGAVERARAAGVVVLAFVLLARGLRGGLRPPLLRRVRVELARWPRALSGFRIVQISDIHIGSLLERRFARHLTERVNALDPDLVAITGDLVDGAVSKLRDEVLPFAELRGRHGVYFVTGNHDHYSGADGWSRCVAELGITVLRNERRTIAPLAGAGAGAGQGDGEDAVFELAGVDDHRGAVLPGDTGGEDLERALAELPPGRPVVLLAHDPTTFKKASRMGVDLQLSGHTHGGQIWPFEYFVRLAVPFVAGLYRRGEAQLYVSRGSGFWGPPMRLRAPAEITEITLVGRTKQDDRVE